MLGIFVYLADSNKNRNIPAATQHICLAKKYTKCGNRVPTTPKWTIHFSVIL
jgi:hypothetical protein